MPDKNNWTATALETITRTKHLLSNISIKVRTQQFKIFLKLFSPKACDKILDVGASSNETLKDSNMFERLYPFPEKLTAVTIEDIRILKKLYPKIKIIKITPNKPLPFKKNEFDIVTSWATLEHVGNAEKQKFFMRELLRVGKKNFITTPYKYCFYEPHSEVFFIHWLPDKWFRKLLNILGKKFWAKEQNLRLVGIKEVKNLISDRDLKVKLFFTAGFLPTHLIIYRNNNI